MRMGVEEEICWDVVGDEDVRVGSSSRFGAQPEGSITLPGSGKCVLCSGQ